MVWIRADLPGDAGALATSGVCPARIEALPRATLDGLGVAYSALSYSGAHRNIDPSRRYRNLIYLKPWLVLENLNPSEGSHSAPFLKGGTYKDTSNVSALWEDDPIPMG